MLEFKFDTQLLIEGKNLSEVFCIIGRKQKGYYRYVDQGKRLQFSKWPDADTGTAGLI